ncbi:MAG: 2OG-Fe(II) oxygenase [Candidatus Eremiobacteraeota bacterium]|nr:2OG-Fe(II) oxygenase [Candidatus Eremiobacteraeota bacterium]MCW5869574.1 2OG-Fe(II) oxygenase [Candidatus Eremiobacteraeota bacterium]
MLSFLVPYRVRPQLLEADELERLALAVLNSPYLAASDLDQGFQQTYGFSVLFQRSQVERFLLMLPSARPCLEKVLRPDCQAFLVNPLVIHEGAAVAPHADKTLLSFLPPGSKVPFPYRVSVLYLCLPPNLQGGELVFHRNALIKARFQPRVNTLLEFPGWLYHEVKPWKQSGMGTRNAPRVSLVCEQYRLKPQLLEQIPEFHLESTRSFAEFLADGERDLLETGG